jgi:hypothetical protein
MAFHFDILTKLRVNKYCGGMIWKVAPAGTENALVVAAFCNLRDTYLLQGGLPLQSISFLPPLYVYVFVYGDYC